MSRCIRCGEPLPSVGDCARCYKVGATPVKVPSLLSRELKLGGPEGALRIDQPLGDRSGQDAITDPAEDEKIRARVAPLWRRAGATAIDVAAVAALAALYLGVAAIAVGVKAPPSTLTGLDRAMVVAHALDRVLVPGFVLMAILSLAYGAAFGWLWEGRTLGRWLFQIHLVDKTGLPPTPVRAVIRSVLSLFSFAIFLGGFWLALFDRRGQTLHDKLTSTFVVRFGEVGH